MTARGDLFIASEKGALTTKPRPVVVVQSEAAARHTTLTVCLLSAELSGRGLFRLPISPTPQNGLSEASEIQIDRIFTFRRASLDKPIGRLAPDDMARVDEALRRWLSL